METKFCKGCLEIKNITDFGKNKNLLDGYNFYCKNCAKIKNKISQQKYKELYNAKRSEYSKINKDKENKRKNEYVKNRRKYDFLYKLKLTIRKNISRAFSKKSMTKNSNTQQILGCSYEDFKQHLESKFESWMNWDNYGKYDKDKTNIGWDIDHIIPSSIAVTEEELVKLNHYTNLQPLCSNYNRNIKKGKLNFPFIYPSIR